MNAHNHSMALNRLLKSAIALTVLTYSTTSFCSDQSVDELSLDDVLQGFEAEETRVETAIDDVEDDLMSGFDDPEGDSLVTAELLPIRPQPSFLRGYWLNSLSWNTAHHQPTSGQTDFRGLSKLSTKLWLEVEGELLPGWKTHGDGYLRQDFSYALNGRSQYTSTLLERYEKEAEWGELWLAGSLSPSLDLKLGRQTVVWGQSDYLRVNDTINPMDLREPGLGELETLRRPVGMVRADYFTEEWTVTALAIAENRPHLAPVCGSDFLPTSCSTATFIDQFPANGWRQMEWGLSLMGRFSGWDLSLYGARANHDVSYQSGQTLRYARVGQIGAAINIAEGSWLWKGETALFSGLRYTGTSRDYRRFDLLLGGEYRGINDVTLSVEVVRRGIDSYDTPLALSTDNIEQISTESALAYQHDLLNNTFHLKGVLTRKGLNLNSGGATRLSIDYDLDDHWSVSGGVIDYQNSQYPPYWGDNDRLYLELRNDF
ncbi:MAG: hypothetical protein HON68_00165 [Gammaproteobacteria bacterium]|jgi:hypothetical protein|nr:hypothetical protein [Gammaproteobacteria bacterium]MBT3489147.1 hypothetical protein [Gammaproteobacteria bacterium]MBT3719356.1 hypothetical protein [Gammaproteobacteria bacterium]MBT3845342.1 hypothetical protein [Gammaproteobacteria bacterium]MBT3892496.1 hypothetical protein [Gammaproteobacteria bacterium]